VAAFVTDPLAVARRQLLRLARTPQQAIAALTSPVLFLTLFRYVFGGAIPVPGLPYVDYVVPAMLVQNLIFLGFTSAAGQYTLICLAWCAGLTAVASAAALRSYRRL